MNIKYIQQVLVVFMAVSIVGSQFFTVPVSHAQSSGIWSDPINLSNAGSSTNPTMVIDAKGTIHVIWIDQFEGYKYTKSSDGVNWTAPKAVRFPFSPKLDTVPVLLADQKGGIYALWQSQKTNALYYSKGTSEVDASSKWSSSQKLADSVIAFDAVLGSNSTLHIGYVSGLLSTESNLVLENNSNPSGVYYRQLKGNSWSAAETLYLSQYFRSLKREDANIHLAVSKKNELETVYVVWDDRPQKQILLSKSLDGGKHWESPAHIHGPQDSPGAPYNINIGVTGENVLLLWQSGIPESQCAQYSQWSVDGGEQFGPPVSMLDESSGCPQASISMMLDEAHFVIWLRILDDVSLVAWNGSNWSQLQTQNEVATFVNPSTFDSVIFGCQRASTHTGRLFVVGCDQGTGGDIWFMSRSLGTVADWFPPSMTWSIPVKLTDVYEHISDLRSVSDDENRIHTFWVQTPVSDGNEGSASIQYERWSSEGRSSPVAIISGLDGDPIQLTAAADSRNRLLLSWVDAKTGDISFGWTDLDRANAPSSWEISSVSSVSQANSSPDIVVDGAGLIILAYAVPINEYRGIYIVKSEDNGTTWTKPLEIFDATSAGWDIVDQPKLSLTADGRLHVMFQRYSLQGGSRRSLGLYYSQSADGGSIWSNPEVVSEHAILWSAIVNCNGAILHRLWQEYEQSMFVSFHQISRDEGQTWSTPIIISNIAADTSLATQTVDRAGNLHFLQFTSKEDLTLLRQWIWDNSRWTSQQPEELYIQDRGVPSLIAAETSSGGNLQLSVLINASSTGGELDRILSMDESLGLPEGIQTPHPAIIPAAMSTAVITEAASAVSVSTQDSTMVGISESSAPSSKNLIGFLLLGGLLILVSLVFRPLSRKNKSSEDSPR